MLHRFIAIAFAHVLFFWGSKNIAALHRILSSNYLTTRSVFVMENRSFLVHIRDDKKLL